MKLTFREIEPFVKSPNKAARVILLYGPDSGLVRERSDILGRTVVADLNDPFNVCVLRAETLLSDPARLSDEANAISMMGGDRLIRIEDAADKITPLLKAYLEAPSAQALVLLIAEELGPKSTLRSLCERAKNAAALPCYVDDERSVAGLIQAAVQEARQSIDRDAVTWLAANISGDRARIRRELEKLLLYKGEEGGAISLSDAQNACGYGGAQNFDDIAYSVAGRKPEAALRAFDLLMRDGENFLTILRVLQNHFRRLHMVRANIDAGQGMEEVLSKLHPPIFFKYKDAFTAQVRAWSLPALGQVLSRLAELEAQCKTTGAPAETLCAQAILGLSKSRAS